MRNEEMNQESFGKLANCNQRQFLRLMMSQSASSTFNDTFYSSVCWLSIEVWSLLTNDDHSESRQRGSSLILIVWRSGTGSDRCRTKFPRICDILLRLVLFHLFIRWDSLNLIECSSSDLGVVLDHLQRVAVLLEGLISITFSRTSLSTHFSYGNLVFSLQLLATTLICE